MKNILYSILALFSLVVLVFSATEEPKRPELPNTGTLENPFKD